MIFALISAFLISLISLIGIYIHNTNQKWIAFAAGVMISTSLLLMLPKIGNLNPNALNFVFVGVIIALFLEKLLWRHCHKIGKCEVHPFGKINLIGDFFHNFLDGIAIAVSFNSNFLMGIYVSISIALHEIPQEISDFSILLEYGYKKSKALVLNLLVGLSAILGVLLANFFPLYLVPFLLAISAGNFLYIGLSDLLPRTKKNFIYILLGIGIMIIFKFFHGL